jgi:hypothetical protein
MHTRLSAQSSELFPGKAKEKAGFARLSDLFVLKLAVDLSLANSEHLRTTYRAGSLSRWFAILHGYAFGIFHFPFGAALDTIRLHLVTSLFSV